MGTGTAALAVAREALVVFEDRADSRLLRCLAPGFRHCFCLTGDGLRWTLCDPLKSRLAVAAVDGLGAAELARHLAIEGRRVLLGRVAEMPESRLVDCLRPLTCVEVVKRLVGLVDGGVHTPRQLYRRLLAGGTGGLPFSEL